MRFVCGPHDIDMPLESGALRVVLYGQPGAPDRGSAGEAARAELARRKLRPAERAWDFLSLALSVVTADFAALRSQSPDGWTRDLELRVAVQDPEFWNSQSSAIHDALAFLTTDRWRVEFSQGALPAMVEDPTRPDEECVALLSGGLDSLVGAIDLVAAGKKPLAVSQVVRGDAEKQAEFAAALGGGLTHLQLNHNAHSPGAEENSQRARSFIFIAFGVLAATTVRRYLDGDAVPLYLCENGFIALNPPLTGTRLGSLSTRTAHPEFLGRMQGILDAAGLRVKIANPYETLTKGEMLRGCADQAFLRANAARSTSCGRFQRFNYTHCGRCIPCQVRRAAFLAWGVQDTTPYKFSALGKKDEDHARFDDVRSVAMALAQVQASGLDAWVGSAVSSRHIRNVEALLNLVSRGLHELRELHRVYGVK